MPHKNNEILVLILPFKSAYYLFLVPYASKWNPIEHALFCHVHQAMSGEMFEDYEKVKLLIEKTTTKNGLNVFVRLNLHVYETGIKTDKSEVDYQRIKTHENIPDLNYRIYA